MDTSTGALTRVTSQAEAEALFDAVKEELRAGRLPARIPVPDDQEEAVVNMNRHERRAWARQEAKRLERELHRR